METATNPTDANATPAAVPATPVTPEQPAPVPTPEPTPPATPQPEPAPESYNFQAPEGKDYDSQLIGAYAEGAKKAGLSQAKATELLEAMAPALATRQQEQIASIHAEWATAAQADKEFGGEKFQENLGTARKALEAFGTPELRTLLDQTGLGSHPEVLRAFFRAGKAISEDRIVTGSAPHAPSDDKSFYNNSNMT